MDIRLGGIYNNHVEIIQAKKNKVKYNTDENKEAFNEQQIHIIKLVKENFELKEKIAKLEQSPKKEKL